MLPIVPHAANRGDMRYNTTKVEVVLLISENNISLELGLLAIIGYKIICADFFYVLGKDA